MGRGIIHDSFQSCRRAHLESFPSEDRLLAGIVCDPDGHARANDLAFARRTQRRCSRNGRRTLLGAVDGFHAGEGHHVLLALHAASGIGRSRQQTGPTTDATTDATAGPTLGHVRRRRLRLLQSARPHAGGAQRRSAVFRYRPRCPAHDRHPLRACSPRRAAHLRAASRPSVRILIRVTPVRCHDRIAMPPRVRL
ncbi:hypothetical protein LMG28690_06410 [Paraburkholderia caffeinilytica]|nr:hypothetical protein LMG28690_06410 [Paraburkholderia caffeinilytica]